MQERKIVRHKDIGDQYFYLIGIRQKNDSN
jgi:hypothetical protein